jgi:hypothetical protein
MGQLLHGSARTTAAVRRTIQHSQESIAAMAKRYDLNPMKCPRIASTDLDGLTCKTPLAVRTSGVAAQRSTSVAWKRSVGGMVRPSAWAGLRLMRNSYCIGYSAGMSAGLAPRRILPTMVPARRRMARGSGSNGQVERMNRTLKDATVKTYHY